MQLLGYMFYRYLFFNASTLLPKNKISTSTPPLILSIKSAILLQSLSTHVPEAPGSLRLLSLSFNGHTFYKFLDILTLISNYPVGLEEVELYCNVVEQTATIFDITLIFTLGLITAVKKNKSWAIVNWNVRDVAQLLDPHLHYHKSGIIGRNLCEEVLRLIIKHWDPAITSFFHAHHQSKKILRQLDLVARDSFS